MTDPRHGWDLAPGPKASLGEGARYLAGAVVTVDIFAGTINVLGDDDVSREVGRREAPLACALPRVGGGWVLVRESGLELVDPQFEPIDFIHLTHDPDVRLNDARCDQSGRVWVGSMDLHASRQVAALYCVDQSGAARVRETGLTVSNGLGWSPDGTTFYHVESAGKTLHSYAFDVEQGTLSLKHLLHDFADCAGLPDGLCVDAEGCLWVASWRGASVRRLSPNGTLLQEWPTPASSPTSCCLTDDGVLYVTTESVASNVAQPWDGGLLRRYVGVPGIAESASAL